MRDESVTKFWGTVSTARGLDTLSPAAERPMKTDGWENSTVTPFTLLRIPAYSALTLHLRHRAVATSKVPLVT